MRAKDKFDAMSIETDLNWPEITRQVAALLQIHEGIKHFHKSDYECSITLASAAEGIIPDVEDESIFKVLKKHQQGKIEKVDLNFVQNWLKHGKFNGIELDSMQITPFMAVFSIQRAITKFVAVYEGETPQMARFMKWCNSRGYPGAVKRRPKPRLRLVASNPAPQR